MIQVKPYKGHIEKQYLLGISNISNISNTVSTIDEKNYPHLLALLELTCKKHLV